MADNNNSNQREVDSQLEARKTQYAKDIFERLRAETWSDDDHSNVMNQITARDLEVVVRLYVEGGNIPLPDDELTDDMREQIVNFWYNVACQDMECDGSGNLIAFVVGKDSMQFYDVPSDERPERDPGYRQSSNFRMKVHQSIQDLDSLVKLTLNECWSIPLELSKLPNLETLIFVDRDERDPRAGNEAQLAFPAMELRELKVLSINSPSAERTHGMSPKLSSWISASTFPAIRELAVIARYSPGLVARVMEAICENPAFKSITKLHLYDGNNDDAHLYVPDLFLETIPKITPCLKICHLWTPEQTYGTIMREISDRLSARQYHQLFQSSLSNTLEELFIYPRLSMEMNASEDVAIMINILQHFKKLSRISKMFAGYMRIEPQSRRHLDYLLKSNFMRAQDLTPDNTPASLWPHILHWTTQDFAHWSSVGSTSSRRVSTSFFGLMDPQPMDSTAIFKLLRPSKDVLGPALQGILQNNNPRKRSATADSSTLTYSQANDMIAKLVAHSENLGVPNAVGHLVAFRKELERVHKSTVKKPKRDEERPKLKSI